MVLQRDALGRTVFPKSLAERSPASGHQLALTIDEVVQYIAEKELEAAVSQAQAKSGSVVVLDPQSGAVLAMAVSPAFDPNALSALKKGHLQNTVITDAYEPGSTMKAMIAAAAIEEGLMKPATMVFGEHGRMTVANTVIHDHEKLGWVSFAEVIQKSSNIGAAKAGMALGGAATLSISREIRLWPANRDRSSGRRGGARQESKILGTPFGRFNFHGARNRGDAHSDGVRICSAG
ncbi:MAG: hypothetical protein HC938_13835 [Nitrospira sp.]|nr:hypothetical protein [Nitrospira sp.]